MDRTRGVRSPPPRGRRRAARLRYARFPFRKTVEDFDFDFQPSIDRKLVEDLASLRFVHEARPILFLGQPGCGKTHLAVALAMCAVEAGWRGPINDPFAPAYDKTPLPSDRRSAAPATTRRLQPRKAGVERKLLPGGVAARCEQQ